MSRSPGVQVRALRHEDFAAVIELCRRVLDIDPNNEKAWRDAHRAPETLAQLTSGDLRYSPDCAVYFRFDAAADEFIPAGESVRITGGDATGLGGVPWGWDAGGGLYVIIKPGETDIQIG